MPGSPRPTHSARPVRRFGWRALAALVALTAAALTGCTSASGPGVLRIHSGPTQPPPPAGSPNIVFVLTDDLSSNLVRYMPHVLALQRRGMTFTNYTVTDSLCCPSRASIFTGRFPHDTHIVGNDLPYGGAQKFDPRAESRHTFATALWRRGYTTALYGKYLNDYDILAAGRSTGVPADIPPGWSAFGGVDQGGYRGYDYGMVADGVAQRFGDRPADYVGNVIARRGEAEVARSLGAGRPFLVELATFAPHFPYVPAPRDRGTFRGLRSPRPASFGALPTDPPAWMRGLPPLSRYDELRIDNDFRRRVEAVQEVDRMVGGLERLLAARHQLGNTVFVFSSDNGFHMGEHDLLPGKQTAFDTDVRVPLIVAGPGIPADTVNNDVVENIDLAPTFEELAGITPAARTEGHSLVPLLHGQHPSWRTLALVEHTHNPPSGADPDSQSLQEGDPPSYDALRTPAFTFVRYRADGSHEYYDLRSDPEELHNAIATLPPARVAELDSWLHALTTCHGAAGCWEAGRPTGVAP